MPYRRLLLAWLLLPMAVAAVDLCAAPRAAVAGEVVSTAPVVDDGVLFVASYEAESRAGHLRAFALDGSRRTLLWDAAERVPPPGATPPPPVDPGIAALAPQFSASSGERLVFTNQDAAQGFRLLTFDARAAHVLQPLLGVTGSTEAAALINAVRGRLATSVADPAGSGDRPDLLGAISRSSPALVGGSPFDAAAAQRDAILYAGAEDGLLHAIMAGRWATGDNAYDRAAVGCGAELWGYLPGSFLASLPQGAAETSGYTSPVHVDGTPVISDLFIDIDGDGRREWRTILVGTASVPALNRGAVFAFDVTDPHAPRLLWERSLRGIGFGRSRGAAIGETAGGSTGDPGVFVTAVTETRVDAAGAPDPDGGSFGLLACALDPGSGALRWWFTTPYEGTAVDLAEPPTAPAIMTAAAAGGVDAVLFGDPAGRLWALDAATGAPLGGRAAWQSPGAAAEPIGGGFTLHNRLALFATGGGEFADPSGSYAVYAVEILPAGARLLWSLPLPPGETLWGAPTLDRFGRAFFGVGSAAAGSGRVLVVAADGTLSGSVVLAGVPVSGVTLAPGAIVAVSRSGQIEQIGELREESRPADEGGRVRLFSWRLR